MRSQKFFAISDIHGFYREMLSALHKAGFRKGNPNHVLIVCGDIFDRGPEAVKVYKFLKTIPKSRCILIRGNHEYLLSQMIRRGYPETHDIINGTADTVDQFIRYYYPALSSVNMSVKCHLFSNLGIVQWLMGQEWKNYFQLDKYIFVHSWIPVKCSRSNNAETVYHTFFKDWHQASNDEWYRASWLCPWKCYQDKAYPKDSIIVCGHWHVRDIRRHLLSKDDVKDDSTLYLPNLIAMDSCTILSGFCNVVVFDKKLSGVEKIT